MDGAEVTLPGGLPTNGRIERQARFRALTGGVEQALIELDSDQPITDYVTDALDLVVDSIGDKPADASTMAGLCVADRQFLMLRLAALLDGERIWLQAECGHCSQPFDVQIFRSELPVKEAGDGFPLASLDIGHSTVRVRVPTGEDQRHVSALPDESAQRELIERCIDSVDGARPARGYVDSLSEQDVAAIDDALDATSPAVCNRLLVRCPECRQEQHADLDHYSLASMDVGYLYDEIHALASRYHWSEEAILGMPRVRRRLYLDLIERSTGMSGQGHRA